MTRSLIVSTVVVLAVSLVLHSVSASRDDELRESTSVENDLQAVAVSSGKHLVDEAKNSSTFSEVHEHGQELQPSPLPNEDEDIGNPVITPEQREQLKEFSKMAVEALSQSASSSLSPQEKQKAVHDALNKAASVMISLSAGIDMKKHPEMEEKLKALKTMTTAMRAKAHEDTDHGKALEDAPPPPIHQDEKPMAA
mmetsp:Transcript_61326/g.97358  ORF Transcript_61326/g.97358 Transcript_61326/m.97358 type:complete len:196 (+) Transcript_61326:51-638(+)|eukprot:CAMPEP_0169128120 /NCGR_PEP_ID=MMETSP1015-20121227/36389_1 /TAXON_ID=342587 /ORGANISM="Karlodinium micrum, Strain CCMP2283" /LENGTH=195 /DNA_ID=CAMNT_0009191983 /DNA_START=44 /DNA_END=631 /DNA_ORIENTATION=-